MQLYRVRLDRENNASEEQNVDGFLGFGNEIILFPHRTANNKSNVYKGLAEPYGKKFTTEKIGVIQFHRPEINTKILNEMMGEEVCHESETECAEALYLATIFDTIRVNQLDLPIKKRFNDELMEDLYVLDHLARGYQFVCLISC